MSLMSKIVSDIETERVNLNSLNETEFTELQNELQNESYENKLEFFASLLDISDIEELSTGNYKTLISTKEVEEILRKCVE